MTSLPTIASMWIGPELSFLERLCLQSFVDAGHRVKLYTYAPVDNVPPAVEVADASAVLPSERFVYHAESGAPGPQSDRFRYHLLARTDEIWVDTDAYCLRPFPDRAYLFAPHYRDHMANGVLRLPQDSPTLCALLDFTDQEFPDLPHDFPFLRPRTWRAYRAARAAGSPLHVSQLEWQIWGPFAFTHFLRQTGEDARALSCEALYPLSSQEIRRGTRFPTTADRKIPDDCLSIHFYGSTIRSALQARGGIPVADTLLDRLCRRHGIEPGAAPLQKAA